MIFEEPSHGKVWEQSDAWGKILKLFTRFIENINNINNNIKEDQSTVCENTVLLFH